MVDKDTKSYDHKQESSKDESTQSLKSHDSMAKGITDTSDTPLISSKDTRKNPSSTSIKAQFDSKSLSDVKSMESVEEEDIVEEKVKEPSLKKPKSITQETKIKAPPKCKGTSSVSTKKFVSQTTSMSN